MSVKNTDQRQYEEAVQIADKISKEMSWIYANYEIFKNALDQKTLDRFTNTYAGQAYKVITRSLINEIMSAIARILTDKEGHVSSFHTLHNRLNNPRVVELIKKNYSHGKGTFNRRMKSLLDKLNSLDIYLVDPKVKALLKHRHHYLAHNARKPYQGPDTLKYGDEKQLIELLADIANLMEPLLLTSHNISGSAISTYKLYAEDFWSSFTPKKNN